MKTFAFKILLQELHDGALTVTHYSVLYDTATNRGLVCCHRTRKRLSEAKPITFASTNLPANPATVLMLVKDAPHLRRATHAVAVAPRATPSLTSPPRGELRASIARMVHRRQMLQNR
jgi:hypothetical protein